MAGQWYYAQGDQQQGPVDFSQLQLLAGSGDLSPSDLVWQDGMPEWAAASTINGLSFATAPAPAPAPGGAPVIDTGGPPAMKPAKRSKPGGGPAIPNIMWSVLMLAAAGLLFLAFVTPWWAISMESPDFEKIRDMDEDEREEFQEAQEDLADVIKDDSDWYEDHISSKKERKLRSGDDDEASVWLWGWNTGSGIMGFVFVFLIVPLALVPMFVRILRPWEWIGRFAVAIPGLMLFIFFFLWFFGAPSKNVSPFLSQGLIIGPYLMFLASLCLLAVGIAGGIIGVLEFAANVKAKKQVSVE